MNFKQVLLIVAVMLSLLCPATLDAQTTRWSTPQQLSQADLGDTSWFPDVVVDSTGHVHVVWTGIVQNYDAVFYSGRPDATTPWSSPTDIMAKIVPTGSGRAATRPALELGNAGRLHLTFRDAMDGGNIYHTSVLASMADTPAKWNEPNSVDTGNQPAYYSRMAVDSAGVIHLVFSQAVPTEECLSCSQLFYQQSQDDGVNWSYPVMLSNLGMSIGTPWIFADSRDRLHAIFNSDGRVHYVKSEDGGRSWSAPLNLTSDVPFAGNITNQSIAEDKNGNLVVVWLNILADALYFQVSQDAGATWSSPLTILQVFGAQSIYKTGLDTYSMAIDSGGDLHLLMVGRLSQDAQRLDVLHLTWNGQQWSLPEVVAEMQNGDVAEWPRIAVGLGNALHAVWFTRDRNNIFVSDSPTADYRVWYSQGLSSAPAIQPVPYPTPAPTIAPTADAPAQAFQPAATQAVDGAVSNVDYQNLRTEVDDYGLLLLSGLPVALIFIAGYFILRRRRA